MLKLAIHSSVRSALDQSRPLATTSYFTRIPAAVPGLVQDYCRYDRVDIDECLTILAKK